MKKLRGMEFAKASGMRERMDFTQRQRQRQQLNEVRIVHQNNAAVDAAASLCCCRSNRRGCAKEAILHCSFERHFVGRKLLQWRNCRLRWEFTLQERESITSSVTADKE